MLLSFWLEQGRTGREQKRRGWSRCHKNRLWKNIGLLHAVGIILEVFHNYGPTKGLVTWRADQAEEEHASFITESPTLKGEESPFLSGTLLSSE